jgi:hypothetical protein
MGDAHESVPAASILRTILSIETECKIHLLRRSVYEPPRLPLTRLRDEFKQAIRLARSTGVAQSRRQLRDHVDLNSKKIRHG